MTPEEQNEAVGADAAEPEANASEAESAPLNREQRRALAKGKKATTGNPKTFSPGGNNMRNFGGRNSGNPTQNRLPRTGHK